MVRSDMRGISLIELLLTMAIVSVVGLLSTGFYSSFLLRNAVEDTTDQIAGSIRKAQMYSISGRRSGSDTTWGVHYAADTITVFLGSSYAARNSAFDETYVIKQNVLISGFTELVFERLSGTPISGNPVITPTILVSGGSASRTLNVNAEGVVSRQ